MAHTVFPDRQSSVPVQGESCSLVLMVSHQVTFLGQGIAIKSSFCVEGLSLLSAKLQHCLPRKVSIDDRS